MVQHVLGPLKILLRFFRNRLSRRGVRFLRAFVPLLVLSLLLVLSIPPSTVVPAPEEVPLTREDYLRYVNLPRSLASDRILNKHAYRLHLDSNMCQDRRPWLLVVIHSAVANIQRRQLVRSTWGAVTEVKNRPIAAVFMIGQSQVPSENEAVAREHAQYGDIVQGSFNDSYHNLTYKHMMALGWALNCSHARYLAKVDDDTVVNPFRLTDFLLSDSLPKQSILCRILYGWPERTNKSKYYVPEEMYPYDKFPPYCGGFAYMLHPGTARGLYEASINSRFFWIDDVYVTGFLREKANVTLTSFAEPYGFGFTSDFDRLITKVKPPRRSQLAAVSVKNRLFHLGDTETPQVYKAMWNHITGKDEE